MNKIKKVFYSFFYGRYGIDTLGKTLLWMYLAVSLILTVLDILLESPWISLMGVLIPLVIIFFIFYRMLSKNIQKRKRENDAFCNFFKLRRNIVRDRKTHVYRKCPKCKAVLRLPKAKGKHTAVCPRCKNRFSVRG